MSTPEAKRQKEDIPDTKPRQKVQRSYEEELEYIERINDHEYRINLGFVPNMLVPGTFYVNESLSKLVFEELEAAAGKGGVGGFVPAVRQVANVAALPGIVGGSMAMPDMHSGYGFAIGNVAAFDMGMDSAIVSPGGVGFDINCGVRLIRTNLREEDVAEMKEQIASALFESIPVGVGSESLTATTREELERVLTMGIDWSVEKEYAWPEDKDHCEEYGRMPGADPSKVSARAKKRGLPQMGTLGAGNHYAEVQVVEQIFNQENADAMGIGTKGQVCIMIHSGSRGLGHQVATDYLMQMEEATSRDNIPLNDKQLASARINSEEGQNYLAAMACAANYAWVNRSAMTYATRNTFEKLFNKTARELDMQLVYDVCHNIAKIEDHVVDGKTKKLLVHRKGATRAFPPNHPLVPKAYQKTGQPVIIGGTMGTCSYVLTGTEEGMRKTFGSTCHGAGRAHSRSHARRTLAPEQVLHALKTKGIAIKVASPKLVMEEAPESYKDVTDVVETCRMAGISNPCVKLRPIAVIKG